MTQEELEYNKRCAKFLGYEKDVVNGRNVVRIPDKTWEEWSNRFRDHIEDNWYALYEPSFHPLKFHSDWNWIMEVVEKITSIELDTNKNECNYIYIGFDYADQSHYVNLYHGESNGGQINGYSKTSKKEAVVQAINQFLIWHNKEVTDTAQSLNDKRFSLEDMERAYDEGYQTEGEAKFQEFIQSLQQASWDVEIKE